MFQTSLLWFSAREEEIPGSRTTALDLEYGSAHSDLLDLSDDEVVEGSVMKSSQDTDENTLVAS